MNAVMNFDGEDVLQMAEKFQISDHPVVDDTVIYLLEKLKISHGDLRNGERVMRVKLQAHWHCLVKAQFHMFLSTAIAIFRAFLDNCSQIMALNENNLRCLVCFYLNEIITVGKGVADTEGQHPRLTFDIIHDTSLRSQLAVRVFTTMGSSREIRRLWLHLIRRLMRSDEGQPFVTFIEVREKLEDYFSDSSTSLRKKIHYMRHLLSYEKPDLDMDPIIRILKAGMTVHVIDPIIANAKAEFHTDLCCADTAVCIRILYGGDITRLNNALNTVFRGFQSMVEWDIDPGVACGLSLAFLDTHHGKRGEDLTPLEKGLYEKLRFHNAHLVMKASVCQLLEPNMDLFAKNFYLQKYCSEKIWQRHEIKALPPIFLSCHKECQLEAKMSEPLPWVTCLVPNRHSSTQPDAVIIDLSSDEEVEAGPPPPPPPPPLIRGVYRTATGTPIPIENLSRISPPVHTSPAPPISLSYPSPAPSPFIPIDPFPTEPLTISPPPSHAIESSASDPCPPTPSAEPPIVPNPTPNLESSAVSATENSEEVREEGEAETNEGEDVNDTAPASPASVEVLEETERPVVTVPISQLPIYHLPPGSNPLVTDGSNQTPGAQQLPMMHPFYNSFLMSPHLLPQVLLPSTLPTIADERQAMISRLQQFISALEQSNRLQESASASPHSSPQVSSRRRRAAKRKRQAKQLRIDMAFGQPEAKRRHVRPSSRYDETFAKNRSTSRTSSSPSDAPSVETKGPSRVSRTSISSADLSCDETPKAVKKVKRSLQTDVGTSTGKKVNRSLDVGNSIEKHVKNVNRSLDVGNFTHKHVKKVNRSLDVGTSVKNSPSTNVEPSTEKLVKKRGRPPKHSPQDDVKNSKGKHNAPSDVTEETTPCNSSITNECTDDTRKRKPRKKKIKLHTIDTQMTASELVDRLVPCCCYYQRALPRRPRKLKRSTVDPPQQPSEIDNLTIPADVVRTIEHDSEIQTVTEPTTSVPAVDTNTDEVREDAIQLSEEPCVDVDSIGAEVCVESEPDVNDSASDDDDDVPLASESDDDTPLSHYSYPRPNILRKSKNPRPQTSIYSPIETPAISIQGTPHRGILRKMLSRVKTNKSRKKVSFHKMKTREFLGKLSPLEYTQEYWDFVPKI